MSLKAGAAAVDIHPDRPMAMFGYPHVERISTGVHDPIRASALYLETVSSAVAIVGLDILFISPTHARDIRGKIAKRLGMEESAVFVSTTHTHSGPVSGRILLWQDDPAVPPPDEAYLGEVTAKAVVAAETAKQNAVEAELVWTTADATGVGGNRLSRDGIIDPRWGFSPSARRPIIHSSVFRLSTPCIPRSCTRIPRSFPPTSRITCVCASANSSPKSRSSITWAPAATRAPAISSTARRLKRPSGWGGNWGGSVCASMSAIGDSDYSTDIELKSFLRDVDLPRRNVPSVADAEKTLADYKATFERLQAEGAPAPQVRTAECAIFGAEGVLTAAKANERGEVDAVIEACKPFQIQLLKIGPAWMVGFPGEIFTDYGVSLKQQSPEKVFVASLVGGELQSYVVTPEAAAEGGYEAAGSLYEPESGAIMVDAAMAVIRENA